MSSEIMKGKVVFISGKITGDVNYIEKFKKAENKLKSFGCIVLNPINIPQELHYEKQMEICFKYIDIADYVYFLSDYKSSKGSMREMNYVISKNKDCLYQLNDEKIYKRTNEGMILWIDRAI